VATVRLVTLIAGLTVSLASCAILEAQETSYLRSAKGRATQDEVQQRLGRPEETKVVPSGETMWVYRVRGWQPGSRVNAPGAWCDEYVLMFDNRLILRRWTHQSFFHGGEAMPTYCVPGGDDPTS
jgi:hypothetical protein